MKTTCSIPNCNRRRRKGGRYCPHHHAEYQSRWHKARNEELHRLRRLEIEVSKGNLPLRHA